MFRVVHNCRFPPSRDFKKPSIPPLHGYYPPYTPRSPPTPVSIDSLDYSFSQMAPSIDMTPSKVAAAKFDTLDLSVDGASSVRNLKDAFTKAGSKESVAKFKADLADQERREAEAQDEPLLMENKKRFVLFPIKYHEIWQMYKKAEASFWTAEEIDLSKDLHDWENRLTDDERFFISHVLAFFVCYTPLALLPSRD